MKKRLFALMLAAAAALCCLCPALASPYGDVSDGAWYSGSVAYVTEKRLMTGENGMFSPDEALTRAKAAAVIWRVAGKPIVNYDMPFSDVGESAWYAEAVRWAASQGIAGGRRAGSFEPLAPVTREELLVMLFRCCSRGSVSGPVFTGGLDSFSDGNSVSSWAEEAAGWAVGAGIVSGRGGALAPKAGATRAEAAAIFSRFHILYSKQLTSYLA
jgi:hypothetical protein